MQASSAASRTKTQAIGKLHPSISQTLPIPDNFEQILRHVAWSGMTCARIQFERRGKELLTARPVLAHKIIENQAGDYRHAAAHHVMAGEP